MPTSPKEPSSLWKALAERQSHRQFSGNGVSLAHLSSLLWSIGISTARPREPSSSLWNETRRTYPSAGARYPLEAYVLALKCQGLEPGVYHFNVRCHALDLLTNRSLGAWLVQVTGEKWAAFADCAIILTAVFKRMQAKYGERGYRYVLMEAGHMMQNLCLTAQALGLGLCPCGGFLDSQVDSLLQIDGVDESALYIAILGTQPRRVGKLPSMGGLVRQRKPKVSSGVDAAKRPAVEEWGAD